MLLPKYSLIAYSSEKHNDSHAIESWPTPVLTAALTHTLTHTGKRTDGAHGAKSFRPHPFCGKNARKALYTNGWRVFYHLVRMRSAVRIRPAAPHKPCNHNGYRVLVLSANAGKMRFDYYLTTGAYDSSSCSVGQNTLQGRNIGSTEKQDWENWEITKISRVHKNSIFQIAYC